MSRQPPRGRRRDEAARKATGEWFIFGSASGGFVIAGYLTVTKLMGGSAAFCTAGGGCDAVQSSRYAMLLGVPVALWGALAYAAVAGLAAAGRTATRWQWAFAIAAGAVGFSAYLTWISAAVIGALCGYCLTSAAISVVLLALLIWRRHAHAGRRGASPGRLVTIGGASALGAIVVGAFIFAANPESAEPAYREALARHLTARGMVMYGAFT